MNKIELVKEYILEEIKQGKITEGQRLSGCRELALKLSINKITVNRAYKLLEEQHIVYCVPRGGYYLIGNDTEDEILPKDVDFRTIKPDSTLIPYKAFTHAINRTIEEHKKMLFQYEAPLGLINLRETLKGRFEISGVYAESSQIMITNGAQQGIYLALKTLFSTHSDHKLLVEIPTYSLIPDIARNLNIECIGIKRDSNGIDLEELESIFRKEAVKAFYVIPRHHNPTGYSLTEKNKRKIAELCYRYRVSLIEDDYLADLATDKRTLPLHYYDTHQLTFYIRSFSKTFIPGIRIGAMVIPETFCNSVMKQKHLLDLSTSSLPQGALDFFIKSGMYDQHIRKVNACYKRKLSKAKEILTRMSPPGLSFFVPKQGLFLWLTLPSQVSIDTIADKLAQHNIRIRSSAMNCITDKSNQNISLCISGVPENDLNALRIVLKVIKNELQLNPITIS